MKRTARMILAFVLSFILAIPAFQYNASAEGAPLDGYICLMGEKEYYFYHNFSADRFEDEYMVDYKGKEYGGISVDVSKRLIKFNNVNFPNAMFTIDIFSDDKFEVNLTGTNTLGSIFTHSSLSFTGNGTLKLNDMMEAGNIINISDTTNVSVKGLKTVGIQVGSNATFTIDQPKYAFNKNGFYSFAPDNSLIHMELYEKTDEKDLVKYAGTVNEPIKWKMQEELSNAYDQKMTEKDMTTRYILADFKAMGTLYKNWNTGDYYLRTYHIVPTNSTKLELTKITYDAQSGTWKESENEGDTYTNYVKDGEEVAANPLEESDYYAFSDTWKDEFPASVSENAVKGYVRFNYDFNYGSGNYLYLDGGKKYIFVNDENINMSVFPTEGGYVFERVNAAQPYYSFSERVEPGEAYPTYAYSQVDNPDFKPTYIYHYFAYNTKLVFSPKPADTGTGSGSDSGSGGNSDQTEKAKVGDTVQKDNGAFTLTQGSGGKNEAKISSNDQTKGKKTITVPADVEIDGTKVPVTAIADNAFSGNTKLTTLKFKGKNLKKIGKKSFAKCTKLKKTSLPDSVTEIGKNAFDGDKNLSDLTINGNNLKKVGKNALRGIKKNAKVTIKAKNKTQYNKIVNMIKKAGNKKLKFKFKKYKK
ncbi:MAG: leucine-rich repeat domain-containing protein [Lachnospiraceae bacterium]|nr:leucine-rich repeat domain-containing protein [Lachnospiraceae bacterium]